MFDGVTRSVTGRAWRLRAIDDRLAIAHAQRLAVPEIVGRLLAARGVPLDAGVQFLEPKLREAMPDPSCLADMDRAATRVADAIEAAEKVAVFGDYDVDGATSSALLVRYFRALGQGIRVYIPDRFLEGYGPNPAAMQRLRAEGAALALTVDCGTVAQASLVAAREAGLDVIVCDHHAPGAVLPPALAIVNPNRADDRSACGHLAAVGVTFLLLVAVNRILRRRGFFTASRAEPDLFALLDLVALGTVCDVARLTGLNRALVTQGLKVLTTTQNIGLAALRLAAGASGAASVYELGFLLGPRINAGGRVAHGALGVRLLTTEDEAEAASLARELDGLNRDRQTIEAGVLDEAIADCERRPLGEGLVAATGARFHPGVVGIVAGRLRERYHKPAFVFAERDGMARGSGRSVPGVDLGAAVQAAVAEGLAVNGGGHAMAAGASLAVGRLDAFLAFLAERLAPQVAQSRALLDLDLDGLVSGAAVTGSLADGIARVGPFGAGNPEPIFACAGARVVHGTIVGQDHVRAILAGADGARVSGIAFRAAETPLGAALLQKQGRPLHVAGRITRDRFAGGDRAQLQIVDAALA